MLNNRKKTIGVFVCKLQNISSAPYVVRWLMKRWQMDIIWLFFRLLVNTITIMIMWREKAIVFIFQIMTNWMGLFYALMCLIFLAWQEN